MSPPPPSPSSTSPPPPLHALLKRNPAMTKAEFSTYWLQNHAQIVLPYFLGARVERYVQIHGPLSLSLSPPACASTSPDSNPNTPISLLQAEIEAGEWDGCAELIRSPNTSADTPEATPELSWKSAYYQDIIVADERRFLISEALDHVKIVETGLITGERKVIIENGKSMIDIDRDVLDVWEEYKRNEETREL
ncbi:hypothetical protein BCIN_06g07320 [Botrytis cinerea B05.10]|uniref:EthD domain-containing protein n=1 Tax=Botryotinia fuckeliana (strain B05.10) TaxID=332648 RepID=A0A384JLG8_BOTFB|nr:hypothetical protein BCIN_06g07320 [Botrytis cinerea B05.10]ATZ51321.1 hypothetical protein BCIN_06g07320 [Botrytis cinerea B05.10]